MPLLTLSHLTHRYASGTLALQDVSLQVHAGEEEFQVTVRLPVGAMK